MADIGERGPQGDHGQDGLLGERGDTGQMGVPGERGPKGDHGQHGETGAAGAQGETGKTGYRSTLGYLILATAILVIGIGTLKALQDSRDYAVDNRELITQVQDANEQVRELTVTVSNALSARDEALADSIAQYCRENEVQDAIIVSVLRATGTNPAVELPPTLRQDFRDAIVALEPKGEDPCPLRPGIEP